MEKIPTAEQFLKENNVVGMTDLLTPMMIEFAKLHVEAALKEASQNARLKELEIHLSDGSVDKDSILNSYPLENIK
jgi:hypothetical protein